MRCPFFFFFFFFWTTCNSAETSFASGRMRIVRGGKAEREKCHYSVSDFQNSHLKPVQRQYSWKPKCLSENWNVKEVKKKKKKRAEKGFCIQNERPKAAERKIYSQKTDQKKQKWKAKGPHPSGKIKTALSRGLEKGRALEGQAGGPEWGWWKREVSISYWSSAWALWRPRQHPQATLDHSSVCPLSLG